MPQQQQKFLFVNTGNPSKGEHKISTTGRAFVIRKARATHGWSTKSKTKRRENGKGVATRSGSTTRAVDNTETRVCASSSGEDHPGKRDQVIEKGCATDHAFTRRMEVDTRSVLPCLAGSEECNVCLRPECVCTTWSTSAAVVPASPPRFSNAIDPFRVLSLDLDDGDTRLLAYCEWKLVPSAYVLQAPYIPV